jgi:hypothetical protein
VRDRPAIALHAGDLGGWHGATLQQFANETAELLPRASRGSVVCSLPVRMLLGADDSLRFEPLTDTCAGSTDVRAAGRIDGAGCASKWKWLLISASACSSTSNRPKASPIRSANISRLRSVLKVS